TVQGRSCTVPSAGWGRIFTVCQARPSHNVVFIYGRNSHPAQCASLIAPYIAATSPMSGLAEMSLQEFYPVPVNA
ncbi:MAG: hypothetical protein L0H37_10695, partial [Nitrosospira sp.]|nr:hypothetical protein [Nitrosospira sp.]